MQEEILGFIEKTGEPPFYSMTTNGLQIKGRRTPKRFLDVYKRHYDFTDKHVCVIGCNTGGILFELIEDIREATGLEQNLKYINVANKIMSLMNRNTEMNFFECHQSLTSFHKFNQLTDDAHLFMIFTDTIYGDRITWYEWILQKGSDIIVELNDKRDGADLQWFQDRGYKPKLILKGSPDDTVAPKGKSSYLIQQ